MDLQFLHKFGTVLSNVRNMIRDRGYNVNELNTFIGSTSLETSGNFYRKAIQEQNSFAEAARFSFPLQVDCKDKVKKTYLWVLDRNFDYLKQKERMTSTDQIKAIYDSIESELESSHIIIAPTKCSPQAKKEINPRAELFIFDEMLIDLPRHVQVSKHSKVDVDDMKKYFGQSFNPKDLPLLPKTDPIAKWYAWPCDSIIFVDNPIMPKFRLVA